jgi:hypothetical protein
MAHLAQPSVTLLSNKLTYDARVSMRAGVARSLVKGDAFLESTFPELFSKPAVEGSKLSEPVRAALGKTPFIESGYLADLENMLELYASLHVLEKFDAPSD